MRNIPIFCLLLPIALCLAVTSCRTPRGTVPAQPSLPPAADTNAVPSPQPVVSDSSTNKLTDRAGEVKTNVPPHTKEKPSEPPAIDSRENLNKVTNLPPVSPPAPGAPKTVDKSTAVQPPVPEKTQDIPGPRTEPARKPLPETIPLPDNSGASKLPVKTDTARTENGSGKTLSIDSWQPLTVTNQASARRPASDPIPLPNNSNVSRLGIKTDNALVASGSGKALPVGLWQPLAATNQASDKTPLPLFKDVPAPGAAPRGPASPAVLAIDPFLETITNEAQRREEELTRQEAERKARETERDNLNRILYRFLLGQ